MKRAVFLVLVCLAVSVSIGWAQGIPPAGAGKPEAPKAFAPEPVTPIPVPDDVQRQFDQARSDVQVWTIATAALQEKLDAATANLNRIAAKAQKPGHVIQLDPQTGKLINVPEPKK